MSFALSTPSHQSLSTFYSFKNMLKKLTLASISSSNRLDLEHWFSKGEYPSSYAQIAKDIGLEKSLVKRWFIQHRAKTNKLRVSEMQAQSSDQHFNPLSMNQDSYDTSVATLPNFNSLLYYSPLSMYSTPSLTSQLPYTSPNMLSLDSNSFSAYLNSYYCFQKNFSFPTNYSTETERSVHAQNEMEEKHHQNNINDNSNELKIVGKQDDHSERHQNLVTNNFYQVVNKVNFSEKSVSSEKIDEKYFPFFDDYSKENLTLSKLIDYFLGDFPSKCDNNNSTLCNSALKENYQNSNKSNVINGSLRRKELETADFMAQLQMTREMSFDCGVIHF